MNIEKAIKEINSKEIIIILHDNLNCDHNPEIINPWLDLRQDVLKRFGLPISSDFLDTITFGNKILTKKEISEVIDTLHQQAEEYLLMPVSTDTQALEDTLTEDKKPYSILPKIGIQINLYSMFVYDEIYLKGRDSIDNILRSLRIANHPDIISALININNGSSKTPREKLVEIEKKGVSYVKEFERFMVSDFYNSLNEFLIDLKLVCLSEDIEKSFDTIAYSLTNFLVLRVNDKLYRITEIEIYYFNNKSHPDPYVHKDDRQTTQAKWYFHSSGVDITFGEWDEEKRKRIYAGILIRGVKDIEESRYIDGPLNVVSEIFDQFGHINNNRKTLELIENQFFEEEEEPIKAHRVGLSIKKGRVFQDYKARLYRYIVDLNVKHKFKEKTKVAQVLFDSGGYTKKEINKKFGSKLL